MQGLEISLQFNSRTARGNLEKAHPWSDLLCLAWNVALELFFSDALGQVQGPGSDLYRGIFQAGLLSRCVHWPARRRVSNGVCVDTCCWASVCRSGTAKVAGSNSVGIACWQGAKNGRSQLADAVPTVSNLKEEL